MPGVGNTYLSLADLYKQREGDNITSTIIELLAETNDLLKDAPAVECNDGSGHKTTTRTGLPTPTWRMLYEGVQPTKSQVAQVRDTTGMLEDYSEVDKVLVDLAGDKAQFRLNEARAHIEAMNQEVQENIFYGSTKTNAAKFDGLALRYNSISTTKTNVGYNVLSAGGSGSDSTSVWMVTWGDLHTHMLYPKGTKAGLEHKDLGEQTKTNSDGGMLQVLRDHYKWHVGLSVRDWRSTCRICNIDASDLAAGSVALDNYLIKAYYRIKSYNKTGRTVIYANAETLYALHLLAKAKTNVYLTLKEGIEGQEIVTFMGIPIRQADQLLNTESVVS